MDAKRKKADACIDRFAFSVLRLSLITIFLLTGAHHVLAGGEHSGQVTFGGLPVPGATVTASAGDKQLVTVTDERGAFELADATAGIWTLRVEMLGFEALTREVTVTSEPQPSAWVLTLKPFEEITRGLPPPPPASPAPAPAASTAGARATATRPPSATPAPGRGGFQRADVTASPAPPAANRGGAPAEEPAPDAGATDGFLINGSVNNGAASPFAQAAAFGNNRRGRGSLFNGGIGLVLGNSAFDSSPFTFGALPTAKPDYSDVRVIGTFGGPLRFSRVLRNGPTVFVAVQYSDDHTSTTQPAVLPSMLERGGDFSQSVDPSGRPLTIVDPLTGQPFPGNVIPSSRISPQATSLLGYYPRPNLLAGVYNFQAPLLTAARQDLITTRITQPINNRNQLIGLFAYQRTSTDQTTMFGFEDANVVSGVDTTVTWTRRINQFFSIRPRVQFTQITTNATPYFANRTNVSGIAGITGNNQDPVNWGPPSLSFSSIAGLTDALPNYNRNQTLGGGGEAYLSRGRHNFTFGGDLRRNHVDILTQQNPRGGFAFTGKLTGSDVADFLIGIPSTSSIAFGNPDKYLRAFSSDAYITDDMRLNPTLTVQAGARWEYETPPTELFGRLVNLDVAPGFSAIAPVIAGGTGPLTGQLYPAALVQGDRGGIQPRIGIAWRPVPGSSLVVRAGYGVYRTASVYQPITSLLAQQPPLSTAFTISNSLEHPLTLANGFTPPTSATPTNTFAVDPGLRVGASHNWQALVQRDLRGSLTMTATYLGTKGSHLFQEFLPNTNAPGAVNPCPSCPAGFIYLTSNGSSSRHAGQFQLRRRLRNGLAASVQYTLAKATDNAAAFAGVSLNGGAVAQDWRDLDAESAPSNFDQRHQVTAQFQYTSGVGVAGGALIDGVKGKLLKGWTVTSQLTAGSGLPFTPVYLAPVQGSGVTGSLRPSLTGATLTAPDGYYLNPDAYTAPAPGQWGSAGRNSVVGPTQFNMGAAVARTFQWTERLSLDWRLDFTNVLNIETYTGVNSLLGGQQFGLPSLANTPRKVLSTMRLRF
jgi:hypothetical protein